MPTVLIRIGSARFWSKLFDSLLRWRPFGQMVAEVALWRLGPCWALSLPPGTNPAQRRHVLVVSSQAHSHKSTKSQRQKCRYVRAHTRAYKYKTNGGSCSCSFTQFTHKDIKNKFGSAKKPFNAFLKLWPAQINSVSWKRRRLIHYSQMGLPLWRLDIIFHSANWNMCHKNWHTENSVTAYSRNKSGFLIRKLN